MVDFTLKNSLYRIPPAPPGKIWEHYGSTSLPERG
jgi:hypothetical protein